MLVIRACVELSFDLEQSRVPSRPLGHSETLAVFCSFCLPQSYLERSAATVGAVLTRRVFPQADSSLGKSALVLLK